MTLLHFFPGQHFIPDTALQNNGGIHVCSSKGLIPRSRALAYTLFP